ncbi:hypothetical protein SAMN05444172_9030 [Burkholderia sp. GAS332]|nr:hypothetical protein SAMN05444172_9030 [Burkholderia sp. GAS332]
MSGAGGGAYIEYNAATYWGELNEAGQINTRILAAYNRMAAEFIAQEHQKVGQSQ